MSLETTPIKTAVHATLGAGLDTEMGSVESKSGNIEILNKRKEIDLDAEKKKAKKKKKLEKQLGEHFTAADDQLQGGRGVFSTPHGKRRIVPPTPGEALRDRVRVGRNYQAEIPEFDPFRIVEDRGDELIVVE